MDQVRLLRLGTEETERDAGDEGSSVHHSITRSACPTDTKAAVLAGKRRGSHTSCTPTPGMGRGRSVRLRFPE